MSDIIALFKNIFVRRFLKSTAIYASGNFINTAVPIILIPILTRHLNPSDYGILSTFMSIYAVIEIIIYMGSTDAVIRGYCDKEKQDFRFSDYVFNAAFLNFIICCVVFSVWLLSYKFLIKIIPIPFGYQLLIPLAGCFVAIYTIPFKLWLIMKKPVPYTVFYSSNTIFELLFSILLVVFLGFGWKGRVAGFFVTKFIFFIIGVYVLFKKAFFKLVINKEYIKGIFAYGFPVAIHSLGFTVIAACDRFFLNKFSNLSITGIYSVSYSICSAIMFFATAFNATWVPILFEKLANPSPGMKTKLVKMTYVYFGFVIVSVLLFVRLVPYALTFFVGDKYMGVQMFIFWLSLGFGFHAMYTLIVSYIFYEKKTHILSKIAVVTITLSVFLNYIFIKLNGPIGIAQATCLVFLIRFLMVWFFCQKVYPMPWLSFFKQSIAY